MSNVATSEELDEPSWIAYWTVVDRVSSPTHDIQDVVRSVHLTVNAVQDGVVYIEKRPANVQ